MVAGITSSFGAGELDVWLVRTDATGDTLWTRTYGGSSDDFGFSVQQTADGGFVVAGYTYSFGAGNADVWLIRTDTNGDTLWTRTYGGNGQDLGHSVQQTADGGFALAGSGDAWLIRTDAQGDTLWTRTYSGSGWAVGRSVQQTADGGFVVAGETNSSGTGSADLWLIRTDANGNTLWTRAYGGPNGDNGWCVQQTSDGGFIVSGTADFGSFGAGHDDVWLIKTDSLGHTTPLGVSDQRAGLPEGFTLYPAYPNPFNPVATIRYELPVRTAVTLTIYDILGREVVQLVDGQEPPGHHQVIWDGRTTRGQEVPSGIYLARLVIPPMAGRQAPEYAQSIKMLLLK